MGGAPETVVALGQQLRAMRESVWVLQLGHVGQNVDRVLRSQRVAYMSGEGRGCSITLGHCANGIDGVADGGG